MRLLQAISQDEINDFYWDREFKEAIACIASFLMVLLPLKLKLYNAIACVERKEKQAKQNMLAWCKKHPVVLVRTNNYSNENCKRKAVFKDVMTGNTLKPVYYFPISSRYLDEFIEGNCDHQWEWITPDQLKRDQVLLAGNFQQINHYVCSDDASNQPTPVYSNWNGTDVCEATWVSDFTHPVEGYWDFDYTTEVVVVPDIVDIQINWIEN